MRYPTSPLPLLLLLLLLTQIPSAVGKPTDQTCATGLRTGRACCPLICTRCGGKACGLLSELYRTDCCPTSILTGARLCNERTPPCKLTPRSDTPVGKCRSHNQRTFIGTGSSPREIRRVVRRFKRLLRRRSGVRVVDWEGSAPFALPKGYYNKSGVVFESKGGYHAVSNAKGTLDDKFSSYLPELITQQFQTYSGKRLFTPVMDNTLKVMFVKRGRAAVVRGFGAVFVDVRKGSSMRVTDSEGCVMERVRVPRMPGGLSFVGVVVKGIAKVELQLGSISVSRFAEEFRKIAIGDVVVLDDFVFGKPY